MRFAVLLCAEDSEYVRTTYGGYFGVFSKLLAEEGDSWRIYRAARGELPDGGEIDGGEIDGYDGFVVTGSCNDAHGDDRWIRDLIDLLAHLDSIHKRILGVCFGHQILSRALGGKTGRATKGWDIGVTCIHPSDKMLSSLHIPSHLPLIECHRDEVWELPPRAEVLACSEKTGIEMFRCGDHILGIQGHPEYNKDILLHLIDRLLQLKLIQSCEAEAAKARLAAREPDQESWRRLCISFLKGKLVL